MHRLAGSKAQHDNSKYLTRAAPALANDDCVAITSSKARRDVGGNVTMPLLVPATPASLAKMRDKHEGCVLTASQVFE